MTSKWFFQCDILFYEYRIKDFFLVHNQNLSKKNKNWYPMAHPNHASVAPYWRSITLSQVRWWAKLPQANPGNFAQFYFGADKPQA